MRAMPPHDRAVQRRLFAALGVWFGIAVSVGATIGVGILRTPGTVAGHVGSMDAALLIWLAGAAYVLLGVNYTAELAASIPRSGGPYAFANRSLGRWSGIAVGWSDFMNGVYSVAFLAVACAEFSVRLFAIGASPASLAAALVLVFTIINMIGIKLASGTQKATSIIKLCALWLFICGCFVFGAGQASQPPTGTSLETVPTVIGALLAFQLILGVYTGWRTPSYFAEETKNPRELVRSLFGGALIVAATYIGVNLALFSVLSFEQLAGSQLPAADAAGVVAARWGWATGGVLLVTAMAVASLPSTIQGVMISTSRSLYAMSQDGLFVAAAARVNRRGSPAVAVAVIGVVATVLVTTSSFEQLFAAFALFGVFNNFLLVSGALALRIREPDLERPYRAFGYPWTFVILLVIDGAVFLGFLFTNLRHSVTLLVVLTLLFGFYRWRASKAPVTSMSDRGAPR